MELRKNSYDQPHSRRLDELNRLEKGQNDLNLERETDIYQFVHLVRFIDENLQRRLKKPTKCFVDEKIHRGGCFVFFTGCLPLLGIVAYSVIVLQYHSVMVLQVICRLTVSSLSVNNTGDSS